MKLLIFSDFGLQTGYARIAGELGLRLNHKGFEILGASRFYEGVAPVKHNGHVLPFFVASLASQTDWVATLSNIAKRFKPDAVLVIQDVTFGETIFYSTIDWSVTNLLIYTPIDGEEVHPNWAEVAQKADRFIVPSAWAQNALRHHRVYPSEPLVIPVGVNADEFAPCSMKEREDLRAKIGLSNSDFVVGTMAANQPRKQIPDTMAVFDKFARGRSDVYYFVDTDVKDGNGFDLPALILQEGWNPDKYIFGADHKQKLPNPADRYRLLDVHVLLSSREGIGLPTMEAMASGILTVVMEHGTQGEIGGQGRSITVPPIDRYTYSMWGNAKDVFFDPAKLLTELNTIYNEREYGAVARRLASDWVHSQTWARTADKIAQTLWGLQ